MPVRMLELCHSVFPLANLKLSVRDFSRIAMYLNGKSESKSELGNADPLAF